MSYSAVIDEKNPDPKALRNLFGQFLTGVTIITTIDEMGRKRGFTANSFTSVSLDPALILVCLDKSAHSLEAFTQSVGFGVNILSEHQEEISGLFASKRDNKFDMIDDKPHITGAPLLQDSLAWLDCTPQQVVEAGDHVILIGKVKAYGSNSGRPLGYWRGGYVRFGLEQDAGLLDRKSHAVSVGAVLIQGNKIILQKTAQDDFTIPHCRLQSDAGGHRRQLEKIFKYHQLNALPEMLYSVFDVTGNDESFIVYRGHCEGMTDNETFQAVTLDDIPFDKIAILEIRALLKRFCEETAAASYGIYFDNDKGGDVLQPS